MIEIFGVRHVFGHRGDEPAKQASGVRPAAPAHIEGVRVFHGEHHSRRATFDAIEHCHRVPAIHFRQRREIAAIGRNAHTIDRRRTRKCLDGWRRRYRLGRERVPACTQREQQHNPWTHGLPLRVEAALKVTAAPTGASTSMRDLAARRRGGRPTRRGLIDDRAHIRCAPRLGRG